MTLTPPALDFERIAGPFGFTEGPVWDGSGLLFTDIPNDRVVRYDPEERDCAVVHEETRGAIGLALDHEGRLYACEGDGRCIARYGDDGREVVVERYRGDRLNAPNDLCFDREGRLYFSDPDHVEPEARELDHASVFRADPAEDWAVERLTHDTTEPNGLVVSLDGERLFVSQLDYAEEAKRELRAYPFRDDGSLDDHDVLHNFYPHRGIDGMCLDEAGDVVACAGLDESGPGPMVYVLSPEGRVRSTHPVPASRPTNCCFGGPDGRTLYVTTEAYVFRARTDRGGAPVPPV